MAQCDHTQVEPVSWCPYCAADKLRQKIVNAAPNMYAEIQSLRAERDRYKMERDRLAAALDRIKRHGVPMTARDEYRRGWLDAAEKLSAIARAALAELEKGK